MIRTTSNYGGIEYRADLDGTSIHVWKRSAEGRWEPYIDGAYEAPFIRVIPLKGGVRTMPIALLQDFEHRLHEAVYRARVAPTVDIQTTTLDV